MSDFDSWMDELRSQPGFAEAYARAQRRYRWRERFWRVRHVVTRRHVWVWHYDEPITRCYFCPATRESPTL